MHLHPLDHQLVDTSVVLHITGIDRYKNKPHVGEQGVKDTGEEHLFKIKNVFCLFLNI